MDSVEPLLIGGKTIEEWDRLWTPVVGGLEIYHPELRHVVGLYRISRHGEITAIGTGVGQGGLAKRLSDFRRQSTSARAHHAGELINENLGRLKGEVLITGSDRKAREIAQRLKVPMLRLHRPVWSAPNAPFMRQE